MTTREVSEVVRRLAAAFPDPPMKPETAEVYERMLIDLEFDAADVAVDTLIMTMMRLPTVSRIRRTVIEPMLDLPIADEAWVALMERQSDVNPLVARVARMMGGSFNLRTSADPELTRVRFVKVYDELRRKIVDAAIAERGRVKRMQLSHSS